MKILIIFPLLMLAYGVFALIFNFIPYLLWNYAVAPTFGWPHAGFWKVFFICWAISLLGRLVFGHRK